jgi:hypothetical protein
LSINFDNKSACENFNIGLGFRTALKGAETLQACIREKKIFTSTVLIHMPRRQRNRQSSANPASRPQVEVWFTPEQYARLRRIRVPSTSTYTGTQYHIRERSQAFIREATLEPDQYSHCYRFEVYGAAWRFVSAIETRVAEVGESVTFVNLEIDDYDGNMVVNGFFYSGPIVEIVVYRMAEENRETLWTTGQRITLPPRPWTNGRVD